MQRAILAGQNFQRCAQIEVSIFVDTAHANRRGQSFIQDILDRQPDLRASLRFLAPVEDERDFTR